MTKQLVFIASGGRTGTQFFGDLLSDVVSDCYSEHEPDMFAGFSSLTLERIRQFGIWQMTGGRLLGKTGVRVLGQRHLESRISTEKCARQLRSIREAYHTSIPQTLVIESYYAWWTLAEHINEIWPGAKIAGVIRDPRHWIGSWQRHSSKRRNGAITELLPPGRLTPAKLGDSDAAQIWPTLDQVGRLAWEWALICRTLDRAAAANSNVKVFRFEDLFAEDQTELNRFVSFVSQHKEGPAHKIGDLKSIMGKVRNSSHGSAGDWRQWNDAQVSTVSHFCDSKMKQHGYASDPEWLMRVESATVSE